MNAVPVTAEETKELKEKENKKGSNEEVEKGHRLVSDKEMEVNERGNNRRRRKRRRT